MDFVVVAIHVNLDRNIASPGVAVRDFECHVLPR